MSISATSANNGTSSSNQILQTMLMMLMQQSGMDPSMLNSIFGGQGNSNLLGTGLSGDSIFSGMNNNGYPPLNLNVLTSANEEAIVANASAGAVNMVLSTQIPPIPTANAK